MSALLLAWLTSAQAQEPETPVPEAPPEEPAPEEQASEEIVVWGRLAVAKARDDLVHQMEDLGFHVSRRKDGRTIFRGRGVGKVTLLPSGELTFGVAPPQLIPPPVEAYTIDPRFQDVEPGPMMMGPGISVTFPGGPKLQSARDRITDATRDELVAYVTVVRRTAFEEMLLALPDRLDRLWTDGVPLDPNAPPLPTPEARRRAVLELWATRADTPEGQRTREAVEDWLAAVVQSSDHPVTDAERAEFQARSPDGRPLP